MLIPHAPAIGALATVGIMLAAVLFGVTNAWGNLSNQLHSRVDGSETKIETRMDGLEAKIETRMGRLQAKFDQSLEETRELHRHILSELREMHVRTGHIDSRLSVIEARPVK